MVRALEKPGSDPSYLEFFGLQRPPFARLSHPSQLFLTEQHSLLMAHLANAAEQSDCMVVICGADGSGKTSLLDRYISSLGDDNCFARIDQTCSGDTQFYCEFLRQLGFGDITGKPDELRHITKQFLVHRGMAADPVLLIIDNAHLINPRVLEQLCWASEIKVNGLRVLSVILAGNSDLVRIMDSPAMSQIEFSSHVRFNVRSYTEEETANYVWHRLKLAGGIDTVRFSNDAHPLIHRYSGGIPRLINLLCNAVLAEAHALESRTLTEDLVRTVADNRRLVPHLVPLQGKGRRKTDPDFKLVQPEQQNEKRIADRKTKLRKSAGPSDAKEQRPKPKTDNEQHSRPKDRQRITPSPLSADAYAKTPNVDIGNMLGQISELSEQLGELKADRNRAIEDIGGRDDEIFELRDMLNTQTTETAKLTSILEHNADELEQLNQALSDSAQALQASEEASRQLAADLEKERSTANSAQTELAEAKARATAEAEKLASSLADQADEVKRLNQALSDSAQSLQASEQASRQLAADLEKERSTANSAQTELAEAKARATVEAEKLASSLADQGDEVKRLNQALSDSEKSLQASEKASKQLTADLEREKRAAKKARTKLAENRIGISKKLANAFGANNAGELKRLNQALSDSMKALQASEEASEQLAADLEKERSTAKSAQTALTEAKARTTAEAEMLASTLEYNADELEQLNQALSDSTKALQASEEASRQLADDLEKERNTAKTAQTELAEAKVTADELSNLNSELQATIEALATSEQDIDHLEGDLSVVTKENKELRADLVLASERLEAVDILEKNTVDLKDEIAAQAGLMLTLRSELDSRNEALGDLKKLLQESQEEYASLQARTAASESLMEDFLSDKDARIAEIEEQLEEQLDENSELLTQLSGDWSNSLKFENQVAVNSSVSAPDPAAEQGDTVIAVFEIVQHGKSAQILEFAEGQRRIMIGRGEDSEMCLDSKFVSRHHALIFCSERGLYIEDLNSKNGTIVNSRTITRRQLRSGDIITIGDFQIRPRLT